MLCLLLCNLVACQQQELITNVGVEDSIDTLVLLSQSGIDAKRERTSKGSQERFTIYVSSTDYLDGLKIIREYGLPRKDVETFEQLTEPNALVPNMPAISELRADRALAVQLERHLAALPGVVHVTAMVRASAAQNPFSFSASSGAAKTNATASIIIRYAADGDELPFDMEEVRKIVTRSVSGLAVEEIEITPVKVELSTKGGAMGVETASGGKGYVLRQISPFSFRIPEVDAVTAVTQLLAVIGLSACAFFVLGVWVARRMSARHAKHAAMSEGEVRGIERSFFGDRPGVDGDSDRKRLSS